MVSRRQSSVSEHTPVRFYKIVALSFLALTIVLLGLVVFLSAKRATIVITTKPEPVESTEEVTVGKESAVDIGGIATSTIVSVTRTFEPTGGREEPGVATGTVTLHNETNADQPLVATTRLLTPDGILFRLKERAMVPAHGTVVAKVYADQPGIGGGLKPTKFTIPGLNETKQKVIYAESATPMTMSVKRIAILSHDDIEKARKAMADALEEEGKKALSRVAQGKEGVFLVVQQVGEPDTDAGTEVSQFTMKGKGTVAAVFYDAEKMRLFGVQSIMKKGVSDTEIIEPSKELPTVVLREYDSAKQAAILSVVQSGRAVLNPESRQIGKRMFFGKSKDEVRRYLLSLKHVHTVDVQFRPMWMGSVPHVPDHVQVIVKNIE